MRKGRWLFYAALMLSGCGPGPVGSAGSNGRDGVVGSEGLDGEDGIDGAQNTLVSETVTWSGRYTISGHVEIAAGVMVTVEPGTTLLFEPYSTLSVFGGLNLAGLETDRITVKPSVEMTEGGALRFAASELSSALQFVTFESVNVMLEGDGVTDISGCKFLNGELRLSGLTDPLRVDACEFVMPDRVTGTSLTVNDVRSLTIVDSVFDKGVYGLHANAGQDGDLVRVESCVFEGQGSGLRSGGYTPWRGAVEISDSVFADAEAYGVLAYDTVLHISDTQVIGAGASGIYGTRHSALTLVGTDVSLVDGSCLQLYSNENSFVSESSFTDCGGDGIDARANLVVDATVIEGVGGNCLDIYGDGLTVTGSTLMHCGSDGIEATTSVEISSTVVDSCGAYGVDVTDLMLINSEVKNAASDGVYVRGTSLSQISDSNIENNGRYGVRGSTSGLVQLDIFRNNLVGNSRQALYEVQVVDGNYVAGNNGVGGVDDKTGGTLDGSRTTDTPQIADADIVLSPALDRLDTAGVPQ